MVIYARRSFIKLTREDNFVKSQKGVHSHAMTPLKYKKKYKSSFYSKLTEDATVSVMINSLLSELFREIMTEKVQINYIFKPLSFIRNFNCLKRNSSSTKHYDTE